MIEVARNVTANLWKLSFGLVMVVLAVLMMNEDPHLWEGSALFAIPGIALVVSNAWQLAGRRPRLRATAAGIWFGGGRTIPWRDISGTREAGIPIERYGYSVRTRAIAIAFHRNRTLFRVPMSLWLSSFALDEVRISTHVMAEGAVALSCQLEDMRRMACGDEDGVVRGATEIPAAHVVLRT